MPSETTEASDNSTQQALNNLANGTHLKQKRARSQLSCIPCRQGKLKCNRSHDPACDQCIKRNRESSCLYVPPPVKQKPTQNVKGRIRQLESLVVDLMNQQSNPVPTNGDAHEQEKRRDLEAESFMTNSERTSGPQSQHTPSDNDSSPQQNGSTTSPSGESQDDIEATTKPFGRMRISRDSISYVGESHWQAILNGISDLKRELGGDEDEAEADNGHLGDNAAFDAYGNAFGNVPLNDLPSTAVGGLEPHANTGLGFMLGTSTSITREQLIASVPEKKKVDKLLSLWFNSPDPFKPIIHAPAFQDEYRRFWRSPKDTPTMWVALLFSLLSLAASFGLRDIDPTSGSAKTVLLEVNKYHTLAASAAVLADFTKPKQYTIECLILYAAGLRSNDAFVNVWLMIGLVVRLALRMGYHRDPGNYPAISTFSGEMRRRVWAIISMIDVLISFQLGLPSMVKTILSDTQPPRNLLDRDFNVDTQILPPSRSVDELTPSSYTRAKLHLTRVFADAAEMSHATIPPAHDEMMELDRQLEEARAAVPPLLQMPDISELVTDPAEQLMCRFNLDLLYLKTKIVLHRRYMEKPFSQLSLHEQQMGIGRSRKACITCALRVLQHHYTIYNASQTGGQLESVKWYMGSISTHDFLLAAMVICLELSQQISNESQINNPTGRLCPQRAAMMDALEKSQKIWSDASGRKRKLVQLVGKDEHSRGEHMFDETEKASRAMGVMLEKVRMRFPTQANALAQYLTNSPAPMGYMSNELGIEPVPMYGPEHRNGTTGQPPFGGVISFHQWGNLGGVPESLEINGTTSSNGTGSTNGAPSFSQPSSDESSPEQQFDQDTLPDFSMIGDIIDMPVNIDWEMFDHGMNKSQTYNNDNCNQIQAHTSAPDANTFMTRMPISGNAMIGGGTGPGSTLFSEDMLSFQDMEDVNFHMPSVNDYTAETANFPATGQAPDTWGKRVF